MSIFNLDAAVSAARARLGDHEPPGARRRQRSDRGKSRLAAPVARELRRRLSGHERPETVELLAGLRAFCRARRLRAPSRATVYNFMARAPVPSFRVGELPPHVRETLYNLEADSQVPAHQLAFHCFNYGGPAAMSFAAGLPWLALYQAARLPGHRDRALGPLLAVLKVRNI